MSRARRGEARARVVIIDDPHPSRVASTARLLEFVAEIERRRRAAREADTTDGCRCVEVVDAP